MTSEGVGLADGDVNGFDVEDHTLDVVGFRQFVVVEPSCSSGRVVEDCSHVQPVHTRYKLVRGHGGHQRLFSVDVGAGNGVTGVLNEGVLLEGDVVEANTLEAVVDAVATVFVRLEGEVDVHGGALKGHALGGPQRRVGRGAVLNVQVRQVDAGGFDKVITVEEHVVVTAGAVLRGRVTDVFHLRHVNRFGGVDDSVTVVIVLTGAVFVVVIPLSVDQTIVVLTGLGVIHRHDHVVTGVNVATRVDGVEGVSVVLEVERNKVTILSRQVDVGDAEGLVGPSVIVAVGRGVTGVTEPVGVVVEDLRGTRVFVVDGAQRVLVLLVAGALGTAFEGLNAHR